MEFEGVDEAALEALAARVSGFLESGDVVVLSGEVGSGKTTFVRAAARSLGVEKRVTSPTYQIARGYEGIVDGREVAVNHLDLYRLEGLEDRDALELDDYLDPEAITFVEWAEPALGVIEDPTIVHISHQTSTTRRVNLAGAAARRMSRC
ncbi:MAG TPA: tRNA (adenosine(37)-N6)-threonylcarbamoyltransferase complex ATPase subunit type 1 TsaE [Rubrobacteraceae bacterium]|nr:tRNA (adenosine(37)-N6)-threonylcarbamoyltransferase complex ATPase subunit type 1 TsaE [Rubrobacteraceae bacterium]